MIDFKKIDEKDLVLVDRRLTDKEEKEFSAFLKSRKLSSKKDAAVKTAH
ncbi:hypothetical protein SAMN04487996_12547 [Dyadobacter soli]|uniref:Uncharacterized protein n=1 Tax=Dyadobacter soli TaxID=659014 RepID=A0A1G7Y5I1_9BACT|nr:hypothetical protein SAMN04487996_12547 [Dyadobacter soli]